MNLELIREIQFLLKELKVEVIENFEKGERFEAAKKFLDWYIKLVSFLNQNFIYLLANLTDFNFNLPQVCFVDMLQISSKEDFFKIYGSQLVKEIENLIFRLERVHEKEEPSPSVDREYS